MQEIQRKINQTTMILVKRNGERSGEAVYGIKEMV